MPYDNEFYLASAGAGKTTMVADYAMQHPELKILLTTYTHENTTLLHKTICLLNGVQPQNVTIMSWFSFLLAECVRPYQNYIYGGPRIENLHFIPYISAKFKKRVDTRRFYLSNETHIFSDKMSDFACHCNEKSGGLVIKRLEQLFDVLILDEAQDVSGWDLDFIGLLLASKIKVIMVGDVRQRTYSTAQSTKNKKHAEALHLWFTFLESKGFGTIKYLNYSHRCTQNICDFADELFPSLPKTKSFNTLQDNHIGMFCLKSCDLHLYYLLYAPQILIHDVKATPKALGLPARNYGAVKGQTFDRVVIIPTKPIEKYICSGNLSEVEKGKDKFYVAVTRARLSVAFLTDKTQVIQSITTWKRPE